MLPGNCTGSQSRYFPPQYAGSKLQLPDAAAALAANARYAIRCANEGVWDADLGGNYLGSVQIESAQAPGALVFGQVNAVNAVRVHDGPLKQVEHRMEIDGKMTGKYEWFPEDLLYEETISHSRLYIKNNADTLYVYIEDDRLASAANFQLKFSNADYSGPMSSGKYHFLLENFSS